MFDVQTDHKIVTYGADLMKLCDANSGAEIVVASREDGIWTVHADGIDDVTTPNRSDAVDAMIHNHALNLLPGDGFSCLEPHGLREMP